MLVVLNASLVQRLDKPLASLGEDGQSGQCELAIANPPLGWCLQPALLEHLFCIETLLSLPQSAQSKQSKQSDESNSPLSQDSAGLQPLPAQRLTHNASEETEMGQLHSLFFLHLRLHVRC